MYETLLVSQIPSPPYPLVPHILPRDFCPILKTLWNSSSQYLTIPACDWQLNNQGVSCVKMPTPDFIP